MEQLAQVESKIRTLLFTNGPMQRFKIESECGYQRDDVVRCIQRLRNDGDINKVDSHYQLTARGRRSILNGIGNSQDQDDSNADPKEKLNDLFSVGSPTETVNVSAPRITKSLTLDEAIEKLCDRFSPFEVAQAALRYLDQEHQRLRMIEQSVIQLKTIGDD